MERITAKELYDKLKTTDQIIFREINLTEIDLTEYTSIYFQDCIFTAQVNFIDKSIDKKSKTLVFKSCILNNCSITHCNLALIDICDVKFTSIDIRFCKVDLAKFYDNTVFGQFSIFESEFSDLLYVNNNNFVGNGSFRTLKSIFKKGSVFEKNDFRILDFALTTFHDFFGFLDNKLADDIKCTFFVCELPQSDFSRTQIGNLTFVDCKFHKLTLFNDMKHSIPSLLNFDRCSFFSSTQFNQSSFDRFTIENTSFINISSFQDTHFDSILIERTIFEKGAFFDNIQIKKIHICDRRTIRTIKHELQKTENKIDLNRFRVYEFNAYKLDIKAKLKQFRNDPNRLNHRTREPEQLKRDLFVLNISNLVSEYGTDWKRALKFTLLFGFIVYCLFYISVNWDYTFNIKYYQIFITGFFRFLVVTDFYNPLEDGRKYVESSLSSFIFITGKIIVAFGIYEMIQSFRKFKA